MIAYMTSLKLIRETTLSMKTINSMTQSMRDIRTVLKNHISKVTDSFIDDIEMKERKKKKKFKKELSLISEVRQLVLIHIQRLNEILTNLERFELTIFANKFQFCCDEIRIMKYICDEDERHSDTAKIIKILD